MPGQFEGKVAIVTGGTSGIGLASARALAQQGCSVMICGRSGPNAESAAKELNREGLTKVKGVACHVGKEEDRQRLVDETVREFGGIDFLVNGAGVNPVGSGNDGWMTFNFTSSQWDKLFDINVKAPVFMIKLVAPHMKARGGGAVVNISSASGVFHSQMFGPYGSSKAALNHISRILGSQLSKDNIRVNCIAAGLVSTKFMSTMPDAMLARGLMGMGATSPGTPEQISGIVTFLCSKDSEFINGGVIPATGGVAAVARL